MSAPLSAQQRVLNLLCNDSDVLVALCKVLNHRNAIPIANVLYLLSERYGRIPWMMENIVRGEFFLRAIGRAVFRGNGLSVQYLDRILNGPVVDSVRGVLSKFVVDLMAASDGSNLSFELDPLKLKDNGSIEENLRNVEMWTMRLLTEISNVDPSVFPKELRLLFHLIFDCSVEHNYEGEALCGSFMTLRFLNPPLLTPEKRSIIPPDVTVSVRTRRNLVILAKVLQNLSNNIKFGEKEQFMVPLNGFMEKNQDLFGSFCRRLGASAQIRRSSLNIKPVDVDIDSLKEDVDIQEVMTILLESADELSDALDRRSNVKEEVEEHALVKALEEIASEAERIEEVAESVASSINSPTSPVHRAMARSAEDEQKIQQLRHLAGSADLSTLEQKRFLYPLGCDKQGRPVVVFNGHHFPAGTDFDELMMLIYKQFDALVEKDYVIVYAHNSASTNHMSMRLMKRIYKYLDRKFKKNLKQLYILHSTTWLRFLFRIFRTFTSSKFFRKVVYAKTLTALYEYIDRDQLPMPPAVLDRDHEVDSADEFRSRVPGVFGHDMTAVMSVLPGPSIPEPMDAMITFLEARAPDTPEVFRLSASHKRLEYIAIFFDSGDNMDLECEDVHVVAGLLKKLLREAPEPLIPFSKYDSFIQLGEIESTEDMVKSLHHFIAELPPVHKHVLLRLLRLLQKVSKKAGQNKMTASNLARIYAPTLVRSREETLITLAQHTPKSIRVLTAAIDAAESLNGRRH